MGKLTRLFGELGRDDKGAFIPLFGVISLVLVAFAGAVVDYVAVEQARAKAQVALDAAALTLQPRIYTDTDGDLETFAGDYLDQQLDGTSVVSTIEDVTTDTENGSLLIEARLTVPMTFVSLVGVHEMTPAVYSEATRKKLALEVAMVLDNSGSMSHYGRMGALKNAARSATDILLQYSGPGGGSADNTFIGLIPFNFWVNIGSQYRNELWMDQNGISSISNDNFDDDGVQSSSFDEAVSRFDLYDGLRNVNWAGCVEARPQPYDVTDTPPDAASDPDTLFVPTFAPDEPDNGRAKPWGYGNYHYTNDYLKDDQRACKRVSPNVENLTERGRQERLCKYENTTIDYRYKGPNADCVRSPLLPLTNDRATIRHRIDAMSPEGATNIHHGAVWGYRVLSPTAPFTEGRPYDTATAKVMILMTDGENTYYANGNDTSDLNGAYYYPAYGWPYNERLGDMSTSVAGMENLMDDRLRLTCDNIKESGIEIYTIGLEPPNDDIVELLTECATEPSYAHFPESSDELITVFETIAQQLADLRLAQ